MKKTQRLLVILLALLVLPGWDCGDPVVKNPGFDLWCGDALCAWTVEAGSVRRVPTWHRSDFGAELVGGEVVLSQLAHTSATCFVIELQAQRDPGVELGLELDFLGDGTTDHAIPVTSQDWVPVSFKLTAPSWYQNVRFVVRKRGSGRAVLAHVGVTVGNDCKSPPVPFLARPDGAGCAADGECRSGRCVANQPWWGELKPSAASACASCEEDADCGAKERCGLVPSLAFWKHRSCVAHASQALGAPCLADGECTSGICCQGVCSACCSDGRACPRAEESCARAPIAAFGMSFSGAGLPHQCAPGQKLGAAGAACLRDEDCTSGGCLGQGEIGYCVGGFLSFRGRCTTSADCGEGYACEPVAVLGGVCR